MYGIKDVGNGLWEVDGKMIKKGGENFVLEGANASAEGEDADEGGEGETVQVIDFVDSFQLVSVDKPSKKVFTSDMKSAQRFSKSECVLLTLVTRIPEGYHGEA